MEGLKFGILASGELGYHSLKHIIKSQRIIFVFTNSKSNDIKELCFRNQIPLYVGNPRNETAKEFIQNFDIDVLFSINYLYLVNHYIYNHPRKYAINFHGSLLPKYRGRTPHVWAIINNEKETGITGHLITENCDEGDIVFQEKIAISENSTGSDLLQIFSMQFPIILDSIISNIQNGELELIPQDNKLATYYGKRSPEDGLIIWDWQKDRIRNWVRAQASPYPGAFAFIRGKKIIIHEIKFSILGYKDTDANGLIIDVENGIVVKAANGAIELTNYEIESNLVLEVGDILYAKN